MNTTPSLDLLTPAAAQTETQGPHEQPPSMATQPPARPMTTAEIRAFILSHPDTPTTALASELGLKPIQVAGYRAAATVKRQGRRGRLARWPRQTLPRKLLAQAMANRRRVASLQRQLRTAIARLRVIEGYLARLTARAKR